MSEPVPSRRRAVRPEFPDPVTPSHPTPPLRLTAPDGLSAEKGGASGGSQVFAPERVGPEVVGSGPRSGWLSRRFLVEHVFPWTTSGLIHLGLIAAVALLATAVPRLITDTREQLFIPDAANVDDGPIGGVPNPGLDGDATRPPAQDQLTDPAAPLRQVQRLNQALANTATDTADSPIGVGAIGAAGRVRGAGGAGADGTQTGPLFGVPGGGAVGPPASFFGVRSNATRIVYVCDASGTMIPLFRTLVTKLEESINALKPPQAFGVIFFSDDARSLSPKLLLANPNNKQGAKKYIDQQVAGSSTEPAAAIRLAFGMQPQLIYVLTDGFDMSRTSPDDLVKLFAQLNRDRKAKVNTIRIRSRDEGDEAADLKRILQSISQQSGGIYTEVLRDDL